MITEKKIALYEKYRGLVDAYIFEHSDIPNEDFDGDDWSLIDQLIGNTILIMQGKASLDFQERIKTFIRQTTANDVVIKKIEAIAEEKLRQS